MCAHMYTAMHGHIFINHVPKDINRYTITHMHAHTHARARECISHTHLMYYMLTCTGPHAGQVRSSPDHLFSLARHPVKNLHQKHQLWPQFHRRRHHQRPSVHLGPGLSRAARARRFLGPLRASARAVTAQKDRQCRVRGTFLCCFDGGRVRVHVGGRRASDGQCPSRRFHQ